MGGLRRVGQRVLAGTFAALALTTLGACHRGPVDSADGTGYCSLTKLPHATTADRAAVVQQAKHLFASGPFPNTQKNKAVARATVDLIAAGYTLTLPETGPSASPIPQNLRDLLSKGADQKIEDALAKLRTACR